MHFVLSEIHLTEVTEAMTIKQVTHATFSFGIIKGLH